MSRLFTNSEESNPKIFTESTCCGVGGVSAALLHEKKNNKHANMQAEKNGFIS